MAGCIRGCTIFKRHLDGCPVQQHRTDAWVAADLDPAGRELLFDGDRHLTGQASRAGLWVGRYGGLEEHRRCNGCTPREATYGLVCEQCHLRLAEWLSDHHSLTWAYFWLGKNLQPGQTSAARQDWQRPGGGAAPAALAIDIHDLRQEIAEEIARYLSRLCNTFHLQGPSWFHRRVTGAKRRVADPGDADWRAWLPRDQAEVTSACRFFTAWLARLEADEDLVVALFDACQALMRRTGKVAPWRGKAKRLRGIPCPECEYDALNIADGDDHVTCRHCKVRIPQKRYEIWSEMFEQAHHSKEAS